MEGQDALVVVHHLEGLAPRNRDIAVEVVTVVRALGRHPDRLTQGLRAFLDSPSEQQ